jgi:hypothetical protein
LNLAAEVLCLFSRTAHQHIMYTGHDHTTDIFEDAAADIRVLPHRGAEVDPRPAKWSARAASVISSRGARRPHSEPAELPPPPPPPVLPEPEPIRFDPNPLLAAAAVEEKWYDDTPALPPRRAGLVLPPPAPPPPALPKPKRKPASRYRIVPRDWDRDSWPLAAVPAKPQPAVAFEPMEYLAYPLPDAWPVVEVPVVVAPPEPTSYYVAPPEPTPPPPKLLTTHHERRRRFAWESPEMYLEE